MQNTHAEEPIPDQDELDALPPKQELALRAVLSHPTRKEAAAAARISETTLWRYMQDEAFSKRLERERRDAFGHTALALQQASAEAVALLREMMKNDGAAPNARIAAARAVLEFNFRATDLCDTKARIDELERHLLRKQEQEALARAKEEER